MEREVLGAVLAGGLGRRLGAPKTQVRLRGRPLVAYPLAALESAGLETVLVVKAATPVEAPGVRVLREPDPVVHPLAGVVCALEAAAGRPVLAVGGDMPFLTGPLLAWLAAVAPEAALVVPRSGGRLHPLCARYGPELAGPLRAALADEAPLRATVQALDPHVVDDLTPFGDPARLLFNVNRPEDLAAAEAGA